MVKHFTMITDGKKDWFRYSILVLYRLMLLSLDFSVYRVISPVVLWYYIPQGARDYVVMYRGASCIRTAFQSVSLHIANRGWYLFSLLG